MKVGQPTSNTEYVLGPPRDSVPASVHKRKNGQRNVRQLRYVSRTPVAPELPAQEPDPAPVSFVEFVHQQPAHIVKLLRYCDLSDATAQAIATQILEARKLEGASDGGLKSDRGTFGFVWANPSAKAILADAMGTVPGNKDVLSSTRSELCGYLAAITYVRLVIEYHQIPDEVTRRLRCIVHCDSTAAISRVEKLSNQFFGTTWRCRENYDLEAAIKQCLGSLKCTVLLQWVRGHPEKRKDPEDYTWPETLNAHADDKATEAKSLSDDLDSGHWPEQRISVNGPHGRFYGRLSTGLRFFCTAGDLRTYYRDRYDWTQDQFDQIDEAGIRKAISRRKDGKLMRVQKLRCGWLPVNRRLARYTPDCTRFCSSCKSPTERHEETVDHVFQCKCGDRRNIALKSLANLGKTLRNSGTPRCIERPLLAGLTAWIKNEDIPDVDSLGLKNDEIGRKTRKAYVTQTEIGWGYFLRGFCVKYWREAQTLVLQEQSAVPDSAIETGEQWMGKVLTYCFDMFEELWDHRNKVEHGDTPEEKLQIRSDRADRAIIRLWDICQDLPAADRNHLCNPSRAVLLTKRLSDKELWVRTTERYLPGAFERRRKRGKAQKPITDFFNFVQPQRKGRAQRRGA